MEHLTKKANFTNNAQIRTKIAQVFRQLRVLVASDNIPDGEGVPRWREHGTGSVVTGEPGLAHAGAIVNHESDNIVVTCCAWLVHTRGAESIQRWEEG